MILRLARTTQLLQRVGPVATASRQPVLHRELSSTNAPMRKSRGYVFTQSTRSKVWDMIPTPVKSFGLIAGATAGLFFISVPLLIVFGPPLLLCSWWYTRKLRRFAEQVRMQRWNNMESYVSFTDKINQVMGLEASHSEQLARNRVFRALEDNEKGIAQGLGVDVDPDTRSIRTRLGFTPIESIQHDIRTGEQLEVVSFGLINKDRQTRLATITMVILTKGVKQSDKKMRVEVTGSGYLGKSYVLEGFDNNDVVINVKAK